MVPQLKVNADLQSVNTLAIEYVLLPTSTNVKDNLKQSRVGLLFYLNSENWLTCIKRKYNVNILHLFCWEPHT